MFKTRTKFQATAFMTLCIFLGGMIGCGGGAVPTPKTYPVKGTVIYKGKPLDGASVVFLKDGSERNPSGLTDATGAYSLSTFGTNDGAAEGSYKVIIVKVDPELQMKPGEDADAYNTRMVGKDPGKSLLPAGYAIPDRTKLVGEVQPKSENIINFELN